MVLLDQVNPNGSSLRFVLNEDGTCPAAVSVPRLGPEIEFSSLPVVCQSRVTRILAEMDQRAESSSFAN